MSLGRKIKDEVLYAAFIGLMILARLFPERFVYWLGRQVGILAYRVLPDRRETALGNIRASLGLEGEAAARLAKESFASLGLLGVEILRYAGRPDLIKKRVVFRGDEHFQRAKAMGRGVILLPSHLGNWEIMGQALGYGGYRVHPIVQPQANDKFYAVVDKIRRQAGLMPITRGFSLREILKALRQGDTVSIIPDQDVGRHGVFVPFFGRPASTPRGVVSISLAVGCPVVPAFARRLRPGWHEVVFHPPLDLIRTGDLEADVAANLKRVNELLEKVIGEYPEQWLWMHRRWKTRPAEDTAGNNRPNAADSASGEDEE